MSQIKRNIPDGQFTQFTNFPAQNTTAYTTGFDLVLAGNVSRESFEVLVSLDADVVATGQTIIATIQDSADNSSFADVSAIGSLTQTGAGNVGPATSLRVTLPSSIRRYIRLKIVTSATTGDNTAYGSTLQLLF